MPVYACPCPIGVVLLPAPGLVATNPCHTAGGITTYNHAPTLMPAYTCPTFLPATYLPYSKQQHPHARQALSLPVNILPQFCHRTHHLLKQRFALQHSIRSLF